MTKVQRTFHLQQQPDDAVLTRLAAANSTYGIEKIRLTAEGLLVEFDATRLRVADVEAVLQRAGVAVLDPAAV